MSRAEARRSEKTAANALGSLLRRQRQVRGLTQEELAEAAGGHFTARTISNIERGRTRPHRQTLQDLLEALGLAEADRAAVLAVWRGAARSAIALPATGTASSADQLPLIGREREAALIERHLAGDGSPLLLLAGEPGIGKTRLLREAARRAHAAGLTVMEGGCQRLGGHDPYSPLLDAVAGYVEQQAPSRLPTLLQGCAWIARLLPELLERVRLPLPLGALPPEQERRLMFGAVRRLLANAAGPRGTLLVLDDVQWAGPDALEALAALLAGSGEQPLRIVAAYRDTEARQGDPLSTLVADLARRDAVLRIPLGPLTPDESARLLDAWLPGAAAMERSERRRILERAEGVPFFLISSARNLLMPASPARGSADLPWNVQQVVHQRIAGLPAPVQEVLAIAAIVGRVTTRALLLSVAAQAEAAVLEGLATLCRAGLLEEQGAHDYRFAHDLIREVVEIGIPSGQRALLHRRVAEVLEGQMSGQAVEALAYHYGRAGNDEWAARYAEQAGDRARAECAHSAAQAHYREVADRFAHQGRSLDAARALHKLGLALRLEGRRYEEALAALEQAARTYEGEGDHENLARTAAEIGYAHLGRGTAEEGIRRLEAVRDRIETHAAPEAQRPRLAMLHAALAQLYLYAWRYPDHLAAVERTMGLAREAGDDAILAVAALNQGLALLITGRGAEAAAALEQGGRLAETTGQLSALVTTLSNVAAICLLASEPEMALAYADQALAAAERVGDAGQLAFIHFLRGDALFYTGPWAAAGAAFARGAALGTEVEATATACYPLLGLGILAIARGDVGAARPHLEDGLRRAQDAEDSRAISYLAGGLAECDLLSGHADEALARLRPLLVQPDRDGTSAFVLARLAWAHLELGDLRAAAEAAEQAVTGARSARSPAHLSEALWVQGRLDLRRGEWAAAEQSIAEALELARSKHYAIGEARALQAYAELHSHRGDPRAARAWLEEARALYQHLGASVEVARLEGAIAVLSQE